MLSYDRHSPAQGQHRAGEGAGGGLELLRGFAELDGGGFALTGLDRCEAAGSLGDGRVEIAGVDGDRTDGDERAAPQP